MPPKISEVRNEAGQSQADVHPLRVVVVEDSPIIRERLDQTLRQIPHLKTIAYAETQEDALKVLATRDWDAVILDLQLKQGTGIGVLEGLAGTTRRPNTTVIVFTNYNFPQFRARTLDLGADFFIDKSLEFYRVEEVLMELARNTL